MRKSIITVALAAASLVAFNAAAIDLGVGVGAHQTGAQSQAGSQSVGGSLATLAGITAQGSQASASNTSFAGAAFSGNNAINVSGSQGNSAQSGAAFALGGAISANQNQAVQQGVGQSQSQFVGTWIFLQP